MTVRPNKKIKKALKKNGFMKLTTHHNRYIYRSLTGVKVPVKTFISHGSKDYGDQLLSDLAEQLKLTKKELLRFIDGEMDQKEYEDILRKKGIV